MPDNLKDLKALERERQERIAITARAFSSEMDRIANLLRDRVVELVSDPQLTREKAATAAGLVQLQRALQGQLNAAAFEDVLKKWLVCYDQSWNFAIRVLRALKVDPPERLAAIDEKALAKLRAMDFSWLQNLGGETIREVATGLIRNALLAQSRAQAIEAVSGTLGKFASQAAGIFDTGLVSYDRMVTMKTWSAAGLERFRYFGPKDIKNREFCETHVGKVFTIEEIRKMDNGQKPPMNDVLVFQGGWGCRHVWQVAVR